MIASFFIERLDYTLSSSEFYFGLDFRYLFALFRYRNFDAYLVRKSHFTDFFLNKFIYNFLCLNIIKLALLSEYH